MFEELDILKILFLLVVGFIGGVWNAVAGGATLFTFPALVFIGLPPVVANASNHLALLPSNAAALPSCMDELKSVGLPKILKLLMLSGTGALIGALLLAQSEEAVFLGIVPYLILAATALFAFGKSIHRLLTSEAFGKYAAVVPMTVLPIFSIYGGYFGAGLGLILLAVMQVLGYKKFVVANALKNLLGSFFAVISLIVFGFSGLIAYEEALTMMFATIFGGYLGGVLSKKVNSSYMKNFVVCFGTCLGLYYLIFV